MKEWIKRQLTKWWVWVILTVIFLVLVQIAFYKPAPYPWLDAAWEAGDFISLVGTLVLGYIAVVQTKQANDIATSSNSIATNSNEIAKASNQVAEDANRIAQKSNDAAALANGLSMKALELTEQANAIAEKANSMSERLMQIEQNRYLFERRPFVMTVHYKVVELNMQSIEINPQKVYIQIGNLGQEDNLLGISITLQNTTEAFLTAKFNKGYCGKEIGFTHVVVNQQDTKLYISAAKNSEIVFYASKAFIMSLVAKTTTFEFILENRFSERYNEKFDILFTCISDKTPHPEGELYCSAFVQNYRIGKYEKDEAGNIVLIPERI